MAFTTCSPRSVLRPVTNTSAPSSANSSAVSAPIPPIDPDPVINTVFPSNSDIFVSSSVRSCGWLGGGVDLEVGVDEWSVELVTPDARCHVVAHGPLGVIDEQAVPAVLDLEARRRGHIERRHVIIGVLAHAHIDLIATFSGDIQRQTDRLQTSHLQHQMTETHWNIWYFGHRNRVVAGVAMQEDPFSDTEVDRVAEPEPQTLGEELDHLVRRAAEQERVPHTQVPGNEVDTPRRDERVVVNLLSVIGLQLMAVTVGEHEQTANLTMARQLVINAHINALPSQRLGQLTERTRALHLETKRHQRTRPSRRTRLNRNPPRPLISTQANLIRGTPRDLSPQHIRREAHPLLDRTLNNDVTQRANPTHDVLSCLDLRPVVFGSNLRNNPAI